MAEVISDRNGLMSVKVSKELLQLFSRLRWFQSFNGRERLEAGHILKLRDGTGLSPYVGFYAGDHVPAIGSFSYSSSKFDRQASIGAYCSISWDVRVMGVSHPLDCFSTTAALNESHPFFKAAYDDASLPEHYRPYLQKPMPVIGNDVWIAQDVLLGRGITIGDGAVVAAGSVVVKDVLPYQIVGGAPAKLLRYRFTEEERILLQWSRWWEYHMPGLMSGPVTDVRAFIKSLLNGIAQNTVHKVAHFSQSLTDIIRSLELSTFLVNDGKMIILPAVAPDPNELPIGFD